jgi:hypothetical protein
VSTFLRGWQPQFAVRFGLLHAFPKVMKSLAGKVTRSRVYYLMTTVTPINESRNARSDTCGAVVVLVLLLGGVYLVRYLLTA